MRFRDVFIGIGGILTIVVLLLSDPDGGMVQNLPYGSGTVSLLITLFISILYIGVLHVGRKALIDYIDLQEYFRKAIQTPEGAGMALIGVGTIMISIAIVILAATK